MITVENLSKSFGGQVLFDGIGFQINSRERIGLVGRNGHGKTTLFRIIAGLDQQDSGTLIIPRNYRIGYVQQHIDFKEDTVLKEGMRGLPESEIDHYWKVEKILFGLGFSHNDMERNPSEFSGGFQVRLNLVKALVSAPDLLLLDEPTNYLDITSIRWIEKFLINWPRELMLITHDRGFMDKVVTHTIAIHRKKMKKISGDTGKLYAQIAQEEEVYEKTRQNDDRRRKEIDLFISRFRAQARLANLVQSRVKTLAKMEKKDKLEKIRTLDFSFRTKVFPGKYVMSAKDIEFSYVPECPLIKDFNISIGAGERICVVGKNGKGKTTLLKILAGTLMPQHGEITYNPNVIKGIYEQTNINTLIDSRTVEEEIIHAGGNIDRQTARNICGAIMFEGDEALKKISVLSGGEKSRVMLGKILATQVNLLLLDEPTNHLDMESCDALLAAIDNFSGAVIMVTHNEMFLHALAERLIIFQNDTIRVFEGGYADFLEKGGWEDETELRSQKYNVDSPASQNGVSRNRLTKKDIRRMRSEIIAERSKALKPLEERIAKIEADIEKYETEMNALSREIQEATEIRDGRRIAELSRSIHKCQTAIDRLFEELEKSSEAFEQKNADFEKRIKLSLS